MAHSPLHFTERLVLALSTWVAHDQWVKLGDLVLENKVLNYESLVGKTCVKNEGKASNIEPACVSGPSVTVQTPLSDTYSYEHRMCS